jgi:Zn-dependent peptidase ImmA (M78 family)/transcriptional regulator with XRE-family HTH domain
MRRSVLSTVSDGFVPARLAIARQARGLKQKDLADELGFGPAAVSKWEGEGYEHAPDFNVIDNLASFLKVKPSWFFKPLNTDFMSPPFYRSMRSELTVAREKAAAKLLFSYEIFTQINEHVEFPQCDLPSIETGDYRLLTAERIESIAAEARDYWGLGDDPISDILVVMENAGIVIAETFLDSVKLDGVSAWCSDVPVVLLAKDKQGGVRRRFDAAHELGHLILHRSLTREAIKNDLRLIEEQAMLFAGAFLLPASSFASSIGDCSLDHLAAIKPKWGVSVGAMIKRLGTLNLVSDNNERNLWKYYSYRKWRGNEPHDDSIVVERPENLLSSIEILAQDDPITLAEIMDQVGVDASYVAELTGVDINVLIEEPVKRPKLQLVRTAPRAPAND